MQQSYNHILTFLFKHNYYSDKLFKSIEISFDEDSAKRIRDLGIIIKPFQGGWHLFASDLELLKSKNETEAVRLNLFCRDNLYINYTELQGYNPSEKILYFNNLTANPASTENSFYMHTSEFAGETEVIQLSNGKINIPSFSSDKKYLFTDAGGFEIPSQNIIPSTNLTGVFIIIGLPEGLIRIKEKNVEIVSVYYNPKPVWKKPLGILEVFTNKLFNHYSKKGKVEYVINFKNRETIWKYFLVDPVHKKFNNLAIIIKGKDQVFNSPQKQHINETLEALVFESKYKLPLSEHPSDILQLIDKYDPPRESADPIIIKNLPGASPDLLYRDETKSNETIYSHIYI